MTTPNSLVKSADKVGPTILIMAGGTGGHIFPGIAVADELVARGWKIHWLGTQDKMEADIIPAHGYSISFINISGLRNKGLKSLITMPLKMLQSVWQSRKVIKLIQPDVVLGMGGYASAPGGVAAWLTRTPLVLHEQNAVAGMTNRYLARIASKVLCAFPGAFTKNIAHQVLGNPVRKSFSSFVTDEEIEVESAVTKNENIAKSKKILVVGGSLGAQVLNETVPEALNQLKSNNIEVWHQTGKGKMASVIDSYRNVSLLENCPTTTDAENTVAGSTSAKNVEVCEFIDDVAKAYQWADVVICRAGALTVSELAMAGKPAIFVPLPHAVDDHQTKNAMYLVNTGAAKLLKQSELNGITLAKMLNNLFSDAAVLPAMASAALKAAEKDATIKVADICEALSSTKQS